MRRTHWNNKTPHLDRRQEISADVKYGQLKRRGDAVMTNKRNGFLRIIKLVLPVAKKQSNPSRLQLPWKFKAFNIPCGSCGYRPEIYSLLVAQSHNVATILLRMNCVKRDNTNVECGGKWCNNCNDDNVTGRKLGAITDKTAKLRAQR